MGVVSQHISSKISHYSSSKMMELLLRTFPWKLKQVSRGLLRPISLQPYWTLQVSTFQIQTSLAPIRVCWRYNWMLDKIIFLNSRDQFLLLVKVKLFSFCWLEKIFYYNILYSLPGINSTWILDIMIIFAFYIILSIHILVSFRFNYFTRNAWADPEVRHSNTEESILYFIMKKHNLFQTPSLILPYV